MSICHSCWEVKFTIIMPKLLPKKLEQGELILGTKIMGEFTGFKYVPKTDKRYNDNKHEIIFE